ncbi:MAG: hypothetical protein HYX68_00360 [Planctomycetes bacterium]|nr:hypothetical protein [Planctomycetota bacterium]
MTNEPNRLLIAFEVYANAAMALEPAPVDRAWMDQTAVRNAYRCLPLVIANQAGWVLRSPVAFHVIWNGGPGPGDVAVSFPSGRRDDRIGSHFGEGVLTIGIPFLFRTPPGINLWVKGPANSPKDGIFPLEGIVETDWSPYTFTMNWRLTRANHAVAFDEGEPICMIVPVPRGLAESLDPVRRPLEAEPELARAYNQWKDTRVDFNEALLSIDEEAVKKGWQRAYMLGLDSEGKAFAEHQTKLRVGEFRQ